MYAFSGLGKDDPEQGVTLTHEVGHMVDRIVRRSLTPKGDYANEDHDLSKLFLGQVDAEAVRNKPEDDKDVESDRHWMRSPTEWFAEAYRYAYRDGFEMLTKLDHTDFDTKAFRELVDRKVSEAVSKGVHRLAKAMFYVPLQKAGWQPIPGGKKGGKRRPKPGGGYEYWYPEQKGGGPSKKPTFEWGESKWTEAELRAGDFDKDPSHWHGYQKVKGQPPIGWTKGGVVPSSNHPVKEKGLPHRLFQIVEPNADQGWAKLKDVNNGEERIVAHDRVIPVYHDAKKKPPKKDKSKEEPWTPGGDKGKGGRVSGTSKKARRIPAYEDSNAKKGTALAAMESGVFMRHREVAYEPDAHGTPRRVQREKTHVDSLTKEKLISEFAPLIAKQAKKIKKAFGLKSRYTDNIGGRAIDETLADLRASAIEGLLVATERYEGGSAFAPYAKHYIRDHVRVHAAREFAGGVTIPRRFARMLDGYVAARAKAMHHFGDDPSPEQVAHVWDLRKRHVHSGITKDDPQHSEPVPMGSYKLKKKRVITTEEGKRKKTTVATDTKEQPGKLALAEQLHTFLTGQATAQGSDFFSDRDAVFPSIHMGVGLSAQEKVEVRSSLNKLFEGLRDHQITVTKGRQATDYKADSGEIVDRMLGLSGDLEEQSLNVVAAEVPMYRKVKGEWRQLNHRQAKAMAPVFLDRALDRLREQLGDSKPGKLIGRAQDHVRPEEQARPGPTYRQRLQARSREVSTEQVQEWRANERARLKRLQGRMADRAAEMPAGPARDHQEALLSQLGSARRRIDRMSNREVAMRIAHSKAGEATDQIRRMQTQTVEVDTKDPNSEYGWAVTTLTDPSTGRQRRVRVRTVRAIRPGDEQLTKADTEPLDEAITLDMLRWPRLTALLWGREPIATPSRFELETLVGLH